MLTPLLAPTLPARVSRVRVPASPGAWTALSTLCGQLLSEGFSLRLPPGHGLSLGGLR